ncbi:MAG TPA: GNAT family protein [Anaerolineales bacterium]|nr:GNAT family protein [Anaerolineales bacterium]
MFQQLSTSQGIVTIRCAVPEDAAALFDLRLEALTAHPESFAADVEMTKDRGVQAWSTEITKDAGDESGVIVVACVGDCLIGMAGIGRGHWPKTRHSAIVWGVYVTPDWRGRRIAEAILSECINWASQHGIVVLKLGVITPNQAAIHCYERIGFTIYGTDPKSNYWDGIYYDEYLMARMI